MTDWHPTASTTALKFRAQVNSTIRQFFAERDVLEVETPVLSQAAVSDPYLMPMQTDVSVPGAFSTHYYLHTSPEYPMKRLLAAGSGCIYQLCKVFRNDECGSRHNPEFTLLEWYRVGFDEHDLMDEIEALLDHLTTLAKLDIQCQRLSYRDIFEQTLNIDPHDITLAKLQQMVRTQVDGLELDDINSCLDVLMTHVIEPQLLQPTFIYDYPVTMSALACLGKNNQGQPIARRFELFAGGLELGNGYFELTDAVEQKSRFIEDNRTRETQGQPGLPIDTHLLAALAAGMPQCAGVALGIDRLIMWLLGHDRIEQVISFNSNNA